MQATYISKVLSAAFNVFFASLPFWIAFVVSGFDHKIGGNSFAAFVQSSGELLFVGIAVSVTSGVDFVEALVDEEKDRRIVDVAVITFGMLGLLSATLLLIGYVGLAVAKYVPDSGVNLADYVWYCLALVVFNCMASLTLQFLIVRNQKEHWI